MQGGQTFVWRVCWETWSASSWARIWVSTASEVGMVDRDGRRRRRGRYKAGPVQSTHYQ